MMKIENDIVYDTIDGRDLTLDIYRPDGEPHTRTAVLLLHGGAWRVGDKSMMAAYGPELAGHGFVALAVDYRLLGDAPWPAQLADVKTAIRWTRAHASSLGIDSDKVVAEGFSAGGHLALMAGGTTASADFEGNGDTALSDHVAAVVAFFPPIEFSIDASQPDMTQASLLLEENITAERARKASPIHHISKAFPPTFLLHGTADRMVSSLTSQRMYQALVEKGAIAELHLYPNHTHEFAQLPSMLAATQAEIALFLNRTVVDPEKYYNENRQLNMFAKMDPR